MINKTIKRQFLTGITVLLPVGLTVYISWSIFKLIGKILFPLIVKIPILQKLPYLVTHLISFIAFLVFVWLIGLITTNIIGRRIFRLPELLLLKVPFINRIYQGARQIIQTIMVSRTAFRRVVMIEYPRKGLYTLGFVTNTVKEKLLLFIPTSPNPTSGYFIIAPEEETISLDISVEEGMKLIVSAGIVTPKDFELNINKKRGE